ncbi:heavy-metal-associated domain-containing protein [Arcobacter vandammei]|uniref:heavy-metal-associated domain-containing protein n=1 Tax=Arcobacter vandammei TaxID=2782243 RepID=UPI0018E062BA|nr:heavy metal-associated domain-containing protein [Arcobacter vandammei]
MKILVLFLFLAKFILALEISVFKVDGMHCPLCTTAVKKAISEVDGVQKVSARLNTKEVSVIYDEKVKIEDILEAIKTTSYIGVEISTKKFEE